MQVLGRFPPFVVFPSSRAWARSKFFEDLLLHQLFNRSVERYLGGVPIAFQQSRSDAGPGRGELDAEQEQRDGRSDHESEEGREAIPNSERHPAKIISQLFLWSSQKLETHTHNVPEVRATLLRTFVLPARLMDDAVFPDQVDVVVKYPRIRRVLLVGKRERLVVVLSGQSYDLAIDESFI